MPFWAVLALFVVSYALTALLTPRNRTKPADLEDFDFPQVNEGTPKGVAFGDVWTSGWFIPFWGNLRTIKIKQKKK